MGRSASPKGSTVVTRPKGQLGMEGYKRYWIVGERDDGCRFLSRLAELIDLTGQSLNVEPELHALLTELRKVLRDVIQAG